MEKDETDETVNVRSYFELISGAGSRALPTPSLKIPQIIEYDAI